jgi:hypothetical protein
VNVLSLPDELTTLPLEELRALRRSWQVVEDCSSYVRRIAHGRIEIVLAEMGRRSTGGDPSSLAELVATLPDTLEVQVPTGPSRLVHQNGNFEQPDLTEELDALCPPMALAVLPSLDDDALVELLGGLRSFEAKMSARRHESFQALDQLADEIGRRYLAGGIPAA